MGYRGHRTQRHERSPEQITAASVKTRACIRRTDDAPEHCQDVEFKGDDWKTLLLYAECAEELKGIGWLQGTKQFKLTITFTATEGIQFECQSLPTPDELRSLLMALRPFLLKKEATEFRRVKNLLKSQLRHPAFSVYFRVIQDGFDGAFALGGMRMVSGETVVNSEQTMTKWLNAYKYHRNQTLRAEFESLHDEGIMPMELTEAVFVSMLLDRVQSILRLANLIGDMRKRVIAASS